MKGLRLLTTILLVISALVISTAIFSVQAYTDTTNVAYVNGAFEPTGTEVGTQGESPEYPFTAFGDAYKKLYVTGGTLVVTGRTSFADFSGANSTRMHENPIVITSLYEAVDYEATNEARLVVTNAFHCRGDVTFENVHFITRQYSFIHGNGFRMIFGEGIKVTHGTAADQNYPSDDGAGNTIYLDSPQDLVIRSGGESKGYTGGTYLEINSGKFSAIHCATKAGNIGGNVEVVLNGGSVSSVNLGNDSAKDKNGNLVYNTIEGDILVRINMPNQIALRMGYINEVKGSLNVALENGSTCSITGLSATPNKGIYCAYGNENGSIIPLGNKQFRVVANEGYYFLNESDATVVGGEYPSDGIVTAKREKTNITFFGVNEKPIPNYVFPTPVTQSGGSDGTIQNTNALMEYRKLGDTQYIAIDSSCVEGLTEGTYEIRYRADSNSSAGEARQIIITDRSAQTIVEQALTMRTQRIEEIRNTSSALSPDDYDIVYYVSPSGNDDNNGLSPDSPWKTVKKVNDIAKPATGTKVLVLFERGGLWREALKAVGNVDYSAYGTGAKPTFYGSPENGADPTKWTIHYSDETGKKIWKFSGTSRTDGRILDTGVIVFNEGEKYGVKEIPDYYDGVYYERGTKKEVEFDVITHLDNDLEFFNYYTGTQEDVYKPNLNNATDLYLRCDEGNPGDVFTSIEFNTRGHGITNAANTIFDNLCVKYAGSHGFGGGAASNIRFQNLEIGWIGGVVQFYKQSTAGEFGTVTRFGNGIEVWQNCDGFYIDNCYVYQCYDAGITNQGRGATETTPRTPYNAYMKEVHFTNNVLEYNVYNIEYFLSIMANEEAYEAKGYPYPMMTNVEYADNLMYYAGYGFGEQRPNTGNMTHIRTGGENPATNFRIEGNLFFDALDFCTNTVASKQEWLPQYSNNTFVQYRGYRFAKHGTGGGYITYYDDNAHYNVVNQLNDTNAEIIFLELPPQLHAYDYEDKVLLCGLDERTRYSYDGGATWHSADKSAVITLEQAGVASTADIEILAYTEGNYESYRSQETQILLEEAPAQYTVSASYDLERDFNDSYYDDAQTGYTSKAKLEIMINGVTFAELYEASAHKTQTANGKTRLTFETLLPSAEYTLKLSKNGYISNTQVCRVDNADVALAEVELVPGDIKGNFDNFAGDDVVDIDDYLRIMRSFKNGALQQLVQCCDIDEDGFVTIADLAYVKSSLVTAE